MFGECEPTSERNPLKIQQSPICEFCKQGRLTERMEEIAFWQESDRGSVHCRVMILVGNCDNCGRKSPDSGSDKIMDEAFQREYDKLP